MFVYYVWMLIFIKQKIKLVSLLQFLQQSQSYKVKLLFQVQIKLYTVTRINQPMLQYLILNNRLQSAKAYHHHSNLTWKQQLVSAFTKGNRELFFSIFELLGKEEKLEFYLKVYFLIYSIHPHLGQNNKNAVIPEKEVSSFREFLDTKGADLAKTTEFLQFYALPFIKKPLEHATFKTLFTKTWVSNLKEKLLTYIEIQEESMKQATRALFSNMSSTPQTQPKLQPAIIERHSPIPSFGQAQNSSQKSVYEQKFKLLQKKNKELFDELQLIKSRYQALEQNHQSMIEGFNEYMMESQNKWFQSYKELVKTAKGLLNVVGQQLGDNPKLERRYLQGKKKIEKYERFVARKLEDLMSVSQDISVFDKPSMNEISQYTMKSGYTSKSWVTQLDNRNISNNHNNITSYVQIDEYIPTNFNKLNGEFMRMQQEDRDVVLEGFCWRLIKAKSPQVRRMYCVGMVMGNFVGLGKVDERSKGRELELCTKYLTDRRVSFKVLELLNYLKVDYFSRQYLFIEHNITSSLMEVMAQSLQQGDLQFFSIALDLISTISVYKDYRKPILQAQLPIFLLNVLQSYPKLFESEQLMELIMMTLMNFSSCREGLKMFEQYENVFSLLSEVFEQQSHDIMMLVNGFYYTLLASKRLYDIALESNMVQFVSYLLTNQTFKEHQRQLKFIEERLKKFCGEENKKLDESKDQGLYLIDGQEQGEEIQVVEEEIQNLEQYIRGHELLTSKYGLRQKEADEQEKQIKKLDQEFASKVAKIQQTPQKKETYDTPQQPQTKANKPNETKNIPHQNRLKKPSEMKSEQIQVSMISLNANQVQVSSIKQEIFNSPTPKIDPNLGGQKIAGNTKEAQFMGLLSKQKNPTFAKNKNSPTDGFNSPSLPMAQNHNLPNFGLVSPQQELDPVQKSRRKQVLKQLNEEIQSKKKAKTERRAERQKIKSEENLGNPVEQNGNFSKKKEPLEYESNAVKEQRSNIHMKKGEEKQKTPKEKEQERKVFQSRPKINRTPPKEDEQ